MSEAEKVTFSLKALVNKDETKVLFVEADNHFVDVLLSFLTMPLGKIVRILEYHYGYKAPAIGSLTSLYYALQNLGSVHFWTEGCKTMLLIPRNSSEAECCELKLNVDEEHTYYFICPACWYKTKVVAIYDYDKCGRCGETYIELPLELPRSNATGVFTKDTAAFVVFDDLRILPNSMGFERCFSSTGIAEMDGAKLRDVSFGFNEIMDLLRASLISKTPLSDIILKGRCSAAANPESKVSFAPIADEPVVFRSKKMTMKVMVQKSTNKFLFAQGDEDVVDFLFSLLAIPLGGVATLLQGDTSLTSIDNLYKDVAHSIPDKYLIKPDVISRLIKPEVALHYLPSNNILLLDEETHPPLYLCWSDDGELHFSSEMEKQNCRRVYPSMSPKAGANFVKGPAAFMITDDLVVTQFSVESSFAIINILGIPMSDVKQLDLVIGVAEGLRILKASLTSRTVLTDALLKPMIKKEPNQSN